MTLYVMLFGMLPFPYVDLTDELIDGEHDTPRPACRSSLRSSHRSSSLLPAAVIEAAVCEQPLYFPAATNGATTEDGVVATHASLPGVDSRVAQGHVGNSSTDARPDEDAATATASASRLQPLVSPLARELLSAILTKEPEQRATLAAIAQHQWCMACRYEVA